MLKRTKTLFVSLTTLFALVGVFSVGVLLFAPEKVDSIKENLSALGSGYKLPENVPPSPNSEQEVKVLKTFSKVFVNIAKQTRPALVFVETERKVQQRGPGGFGDPFFDEFFFPFRVPEREGGGKQRGAGSGFLVDLTKGYVITNNHVIEGADKIEVKTFDDRTFKAKVVGTDQSNDVAVLQLENFVARSLTAVTLGNSDQVEVGDWVVALGAPFNLPQTLTAGVVSAIARDGIMRQGPQEFIQTDAAINPGNSGGPLLNINGEVIGMNTAIISGSGSYAGIGLAVPANVIRIVAESIINHGKVARGYLGINMFDFKDLSQDLLERLKISKEQHGVLVRNVLPGSPAEKAGIQTYDVITGLDAYEIRSASALAQRVSLTKPGTTVKLQVLRDGKTVSVPVKVGEYRSENAQLAPEGESLIAEFGLSLTSLTKDLKTKLGIKANTGVIVTGVAPRSLAARIDFKPNDVILEINRGKVASEEQVSAALKKALEKRQELLFLVERNGRNQLMVFSP